MVPPSIRRSYEKLGTEDGRVRRFRAPYEPGVRRARYAGEALRPPRKTTSEDHDDDAFPASRDERSAERRGAPRPRRPRRVWPILALVTRRDRVQHVYRKRTNRRLASRYASRTIPSTDCGSCCGARTPPRTWVRNTPARPLLAPHIRRNGARLKKTRFQTRLLSPTRFSLCLDDWNTRKTAGVGDVLEAVGLRARWNAYHDEPELASGYGASLVVRATASALLYAHLVSPPGHEDSRDGDAAHRAAPRIREVGPRARAPNRLRVRRRPRRPDDSHETRIARARGRGGRRAQGVAGQSRGAAMRADPRSHGSSRAERPETPRRANFSNVSVATCDPLLRAKRNANANAARSAAEAFVRGGFGG